MKRIVLIQMMGPLRILKGTLGRRHVVPPFGMQWVRFRRKRLMSGRRFSNSLFSGEGLADTIVLVRGDVPMSLVLQASYKLRIRGLL